MKCPRTLGSFILLIVRGFWVTHHIPSRVTVEENIPKIGKVVWKWLEKWAILFRMGDKNEKVKRESRYDGILRGLNGERTSPPLFKSEGKTRNGEGEKV